MVYCHVLELRKRSSGAIPAQGGQAGLLLSLLPAARRWQPWWLRRSVRRRTRTLLDARRTARRRELRSVPPPLQDEHGQIGDSARVQAQTVLQEQRRAATGEGQSCRPETD